MQRAQRRRQLYSADREHLVHRHTGVVDEDAERACERDARNIELHRRCHRAREARRSYQESAASIAHAHEVRGAVAEAQRDIRSRNADSRPGHAARSRRRAGRAFKREVTAQALAGDGEADVRAFDAEIRTRGQIDDQRLAADQDAFIHARRRVVDGEAERAGETNQRNRDRRLDAARHARRRQHERTFAAAQHHEVRRAVADAQAHLRNADANHALARRISDLLKGEVALEGLAENFQRRRLAHGAARHFHAHIRTSRQVEVDHDGIRSGADGERLVHAHVRVIDRHRNFAVHGDARQLHFNVCRKLAGESRRSNQEAARACAHHHEVRRAVAEV